MILSQAVPERPVPDVQEAQEWYRDTLGFEIGWFNQAGNIGAVNHGGCTLFFRGCAEALTAPVLWVFVEDVDAFYAALLRTDATITMPLQNTPWGLRQFTVADPYRTVLHFHHDL
ncbi:VOC family protein [Shimia ponticola]|uniref:VOC family protein n=1 Tax=Shimia ponticola TaxID=2582893 RepID=UPI0011BF8ECC|nr:glyoxalase superfamily protein [Shimia ponticola]